MKRFICLLFGHKAAKPKFYPPLFVAEECPRCKTILVWKRRAA